MSKKLLAAIDSGVPREGPGTLHLDITNSCNTNCVTCWDHSPYLSTPRSAAWKRQRVELAQAEDLLDDVLSLGGLRAVIVSGMGEPFTHPEVYDLLAAIKERGLHVTVITNLVAADVHRILALGVDQLLIGVHGATEDSYLAFHPSFRPEEWTKLTRALSLFRAQGKRFKHVQVVSRENGHELTDMVRFAHRYAALQVNFKLASLGHGTEATRIDAALRDRLVRELVPEARRVASELGVETNLDVFGSQLEAGGARTAPIERVGCFMGYAYSRVLVDGTVLYCCNTDVRVGSLAQGERFSDLWRGPAWTALRQRMRDGEYFESCGQCGKLNQNVKIARAFERAYGAARLYEVTGRDPEGKPRARQTEGEPGGGLRRLPIVAGGPAGGEP